MNVDFAYLVGALGDATLTHRPKKGEYCIEFEQKSEDWLKDSIAPRAQRLFGKTIPVRKRKSGLYRLRIYSKKAYSELAKAWNDLSIIEESDERAKSNFVRGFFDAEGSAPRRNAGTCYRILFYQKDISRLLCISRLLDSLGIKPGRISNSRDIGLLAVRGKSNVTSFVRIVGSEHPIKRMALLQLISL